MNACLNVQGERHPINGHGDRHPHVCLPEVDAIPSPFYTPV